MRKRLESSHRVIGDRHRCIQSLEHQTRDRHLLASGDRHLSNRVQQAWNHKPGTGICRTGSREEAGTGVPAMRYGQTKGPRTGTRDQLTRWRRLGQGRPDLIGDRRFCWGSSPMPVLALPQSPVPAPVLQFCEPVLGERAMSACPRSSRLLPLAVPSRTATFPLGLSSHHVGITPQFSQRLFLSDSVGISIVDDLGLLR